MPIYETIDESWLDLASIEPDENARLFFMNEYGRSELRSNMKACTNCHLRAKTKQVVPFIGPIGGPWGGALLAGMGEGPGGDEEDIGDPFVGEAGKIVNRTLLKSSVKREEISLFNAVGCRCWKLEKNNRDQLVKKDRPPTAGEMESCNPWLVKQIALIDPWLTIILGATALKAIDPSLKVSGVRGRIFRPTKGPMEGRYIIPTWHPAAILKYRDPDGVKKKEFESDIEWACKVYQAAKELVKEGGVPALRILEDVYELQMARGDAREQGQKIDESGVLRA